MLKTLLRNVWGNHNITERREDLKEFIRQESEKWKAAKCEQNMAEAQLALSAQT